MKRLIVFAAFFVILCSTALSQTYLSSPVTITDFTPEGSPYRTNEEMLLFESNGSYTVHPGTVFQFTDNTYIELNTSSFICLGTAENPILFTKVPENPSLWDGFEFYSSVIEFEHTIFEKARGGDGVMFVFNSEISLVNCQFRNNGSNSFTNNTIWFDGTTSYDINHCSFHNNISTGSTIYIVSSGTGSFHHNLIFDNTRDFVSPVISISSQDNLTILDHCTFYNNFTDDEFGYLMGSSSPTTVTNSIIVGSSNVLNNMHVNDNITFEYVCTDYNALVGQSIIYEDPLFVDPENGDLHLLPGSPCIDAGNPDHTDPDGSLPDLGALPTGLDEPVLIAIPEVAGTPGENITIPVLQLEEELDDAVFSMQGNIELPNDIFVNDDIDLFMPEDGVANPANWMIEWTFNENVISFALAGSEPLTGQGPIFFIEGLISENIPFDTYPLVLQNIVLNEGAPEAIIQNGSITILDYLWGDVSMNNEIMAFDASLILSWLAESITLDETQLLLADVSANNEVDEFDASLILQYVSGGIDAFPVQTGMIFRGNAEINDSYILLDENPVIQVPLVLENVDNMLSCALNINILEGVGLLSINNPQGMTASRENESSSDLFFTFDESLSGEDIQIATLELSVDTSLVQSFDITVNLLEVNDYFSNASQSIITVDLEETDIHESDLPATYTLLKTYPNPFNPSLTIKSELQQAGNLNIKIFDTLGREIRTITSGWHEGGRHSYIFDASNLPSGTYYVRAKNSQMGTQINQVVLVK